MVLQAPVVAQFISNAGRQSDPDAARQVLIVICNVRLRQELPAHEPEIHQQARLTCASHDPRREASTASFVYPQLQLQWQLLQCTHGPRPGRRVYQWSDRLRAMDTSHRTICAIYQFPIARSDGNGRKGRKGGQSRRPDDARRLGGSRDVRSIWPGGV